MNSLVWNRDIVTGVACYFIGGMLRMSISCSFFRPKKEPKKGLIRRASNSLCFAEAAELSAMLPSAVPTGRDRLLLKARGDELSGLES